MKEELAKERRKKGRSRKRGIWKKEGKGRFRKRKRKKN